MALRWHELQIGFSPLHYEGRDKFSQAQVRGVGRKRGDLPPSDIPVSFWYDIDRKLLARRLGVALGPKTGLQTRDQILVGQRALQHLRRIRTLQPAQLVANDSVSWGCEVPEDRSSWLG